MGGPELEGHRASSPVRWGNGAADQRRHDIYGEVLDCAHLWLASGQPIDARLWSRLAALADTAGIAWRQPDQGIWEVRGEGTRRCARASALGLLPEQIDPTTGDFAGNFPQAFSHVGVISSGVNIARAVARQQAPGSG